MGILRRLDAETLWLAAAYGAVMALTPLFASFNSPWWRSLRRPPWFPPFERLPPVLWSVNFTLAVAAGNSFFVAGPPERRRWIYRGLFAAGVLLAGSYSAIVIRLRSLRGGLVDSGLLAVVVLLTMAVSWPVSRLSALLWLPYLAWTAVASYLGWVLWASNR